jgi:hypothetical protein
VGTSVADGLGSDAVGVAAAGLETAVSALHGGVETGRGVRLRTPHPKPAKSSMPPAETVCHNLDAVTRLILKNGDNDKNATAARNLLVTDLQPSIFTGTHYLIRCPVVLFLIPRIHPPSMCSLAHMRRGESYVANDNASAVCKMMLGQSPKQSHLRREIELVQHVSRYDSVKTAIKFSRPACTSTTCDSFARTLASILAEKSMPHTSRDCSINGEIGCWWGVSPK